MMKINFIEKDIVRTDGFILLRENVCIELKENTAFLTFKGENLGELSKKQSSQIKLSLKPKRIQNRFKNRFLMKPIISSGEFIANYRKDCGVRDFKCSLIATMARIESQNNEKRKFDAKQVN